jgi:hypothetical protein
MHQKREQVPKCGSNEEEKKYQYMLLTVTARSNVWTVFARLNAGIVGSNSTQGMDVCVCVYPVFVLSCVYVGALRLADHSSKDSYRLCKKDYETEEEARAQQRTVGPLTNEWNRIWRIKLGSSGFGQVSWTQ